MGGKRVCYGMSCAMPRCGNSHTWEQKWLHRLQRMINTKLQLVDIYKEQPLPTQVFSFAATETGSKAFKTGAGYTCRICPSLRWNERVFSSSLSRSLVAAPDIFSQLRIHWPGETVNRKGVQSLLHCGKNCGKDLLQQLQSSDTFFLRRRERSGILNFVTDQT